jgi:cob(I)alamin adenosyltransferase
MGTEVATVARCLSRLRRRIHTKDIRRLEACIESLEKRKRKNLCFSIPGKCLVSGCLDVARTIARRAERRVVSLAKKKQLNNKEILVYLNRLSDFLYLLARKSEGS